MSREKDLIDLIRTANEVFLINPSKNVRTAYILIDDLCELMTKFYLQSKDKKWSADRANNKGFKSFPEITTEVKAYFVGNSKVEILLTSFNGRRTNRNSFFHDHRMTGLTVTIENCLEAFCDLYDLLNILFPNAVTANETVLYKAQVMTIRVMKVCTNDHAKNTQFINILKNWEHNEQLRKIKVRGEVIIEFPNLGYDYCVVAYYSQRFYDALVAANLLGP